MIIEWHNILIQPLTLEPQHKDPEALTSKFVFLRASLLPLTEVFILLNRPSFEYISELFLFCNFITL